MRCLRSWFPSLQDNGLPTGVVRNLVAVVLFEWPMRNFASAIVFL
ncbi:hypothetical protein ACPOL_3548 [Acidisarcina polymorpha]|uniref:Uncharacterized protein n=1 Tax=Acidisarcina polymorpha TaxID=2211140 RepID=A0A2Z5G0Z4_9BACT|nr:hypothetical protein ACPOL_3548 [Acidisarcina polymorpha]